MSTERQPSKLIPLLVEKLNLEEQITVFDAGLAVSETVAFFAPYKCRLHFMDMFSESILREQDPDQGELEIQKQFEEILDFSPDTRFDVCLFWDLLNFMQTPYIRAFNRALRKFLHPGSVAHGFGVLNASTTLRSHQYGIANENELVVRQHNDHGLTYVAHPQAELEKYLPHFGINRTLLLSGGRLEILFNSRS